MKCQKCGREISDTAKFCPYCGAKRMVPAEKTAVFKDQEELSKTEKQQMIDAAEIHAAEIFDREARSDKRARVVLTSVLLLGVLALAIGIRHFQLHSYTNAGIRNVERSIAHISCEDDFWDTIILIQDVYEGHQEEDVSARLRAVQAVRVVVDDETFREIYEDCHVDELLKY